MERLCGVVQVVTVFSETGFLGRRIVRHVRDKGFSVRDASRIRGSLLHTDGQRDVQTIERFQSGSGRASAAHDAQQSGTLSSSKHQRYSFRRSRESWRAPLGEIH
jgi:hypothetical protein